MQKGVIIKFRRSKVVVSDLDDMFDHDLSDMQRIAKYNDSIRLLLGVIGIFSKMRELYL